MPEIKHIALTTTDVDKVADFWKELFHMEEVGRSGAPTYTSAMGK